MKPFYVERINAHRVPTGTSVTEVLTKPFYVERMVGGVMQDLRVADWYWQAWNGCFCRIEDRAQWCGK